MFKVEIRNQGEVVPEALLARPEPKHVSAFVFRAGGADRTRPGQADFSPESLIFDLHLALLLGVPATCDLYSLLLN